MKKGLKTLLIILGVVILAAVLFAVFSGGGDDAPSTGLVSGTTAQPISVSPSLASGAEIGQEFINMLLNLQGINLDTTLFQDPAFLSLKDKAIRFDDPGGQGRPNPFAPIGADFISIPAPEPEFESFEDTPDESFFDEDSDA